MTRRHDLGEPGTRLVAVDLAMDQRSHEEVDLGEVGIVGDPEPHCAHLGLAGFLRLDGTASSLRELADGKEALVVNVASRCGHRG